ncbi:magnesium chelatase [Lottiidibacillus patelloidae]|uniref:Magnesium chelatase n=1 Tax=Lottiidibacillus patelloidae TaxID=2670334 RepID=A0A263BWQ1_9BACI|nr:magnesium chelatase [Lottiidibacillus patelloidae]
MRQAVEMMKNEIGKVIYGKEDIVELLMNALINRGHVLLESVPGTGKTMLARSLAKTIDGDFKRVQFTPDVLPSDVSGIQFFHPQKQEFQLRPGPVMTNILLADEINRATPRTQASLLEVMEERQVTIDGETLPLPNPFIVVATQNPIEAQQGTFPLPEAQMDRFFMQLDLGYPNLEQEKEMMQKYRKEEPFKQLLSIFSKEDILSLQEQVKEVTLSEVIEDYLLAIVDKTRKSDEIQLGVSPRGTLALMKAAQAKALMEGRSFVIPEDIKFVAPYVLTHRIVLSIEGEMKFTKHGVIKELLETVEVPVEIGDRA